MKIELTAGDLKILFLLHDDKTLGEISAALDADNGAVYMRLRRLREKFGVRTTHGLLLKASRLGVLDEKHRPAD